MHSNYWDFASVLRFLKSRYSEARCENDGDQSDDENDRLYLEGPTIRKCFHRDSIGILEWLQKKTRQEVCTKVVVIAACRLPVGLTDRIMKFAFQVEDISLDPTVYHVREPNNAGVWR